MEMGVGFLLGLLGGAVVSLVAGLLLHVSRRARNRVAADKESHAKSGTSRLAPAADHPTRVLPGGGTDASVSSATRVGPGRRATDRQGTTTETVVIENIENQSVRLNQSIQDVRGLLLRLADVVARTENASGEAAEAFQSAKNAMDGFDPSDTADLAAAQALLIAQIDEVLSSNAKLSAELEQANQGIEDQRRQIEELRVQARVDTLTRIPNRASFDERLAEYTALRDRTAMPCSLLLLDIDHFKEVNDKHGHINGDRILRGVAKRITDSIRTNDFAARYGGEEFAVILPGTDIRDASAVAQRVRADIARTIFRLDGQKLKVTVSGGIARCEQGMTAERLVSAADVALYKAKSAGRNQVHTFIPEEQPARQPTPKPSS